METSINVITKTASAETILTGQETFRPEDTVGGTALVCVKFVILATQWNPKKRTGDEAKSFSKTTLLL